MKLRRRIELRMESFARTLTLALFWVSRGYLPLQAWKKAKDTL